jgi:hypothetical protein
MPAWGCSAGQNSRGAASGSRATSDAASSARTNDARWGCNPGSSTARLSGPVAVFFQNSMDPHGYPAPSTNGCITVTLVAGDGRTSRVVSQTSRPWWFTCPVLSGQPPAPLSGLTPGPPTSVSADRAYWWDGSKLRWLDRDGSTNAVDLQISDQAVMEFSVSPDDQRVAVTEIVFARSPLHRTTWIENLGTHAHRSVLFDGDINAEVNSPTGWPWGWHAGYPILYDYPLCAVTGGDQFFALNHPRVVDPATGSRLVNFPQCYGGSITGAGAFCTSSFTARTLDWYGWDGRLIRQWSLPYETLACNSDISPSQIVVVANCQPNIYTQSPGETVRQRVFVFGAQQPIPVALSDSGFHWLDDDLVLVMGSRKTGFVGDPNCATCPIYTNTVAIWTLSEGKRVVGPIDVAGDEIGRFAATS